MTKKTFEQIINESNFEQCEKDYILREYSELNSESVNDERLLELISVIINSPFSANSREYVVCSIISRLKEGNESYRNITERLQSMVPQVKTIINTPGMNSAYEYLSTKLIDNDDVALVGLLGIIFSLKEQDIKTENDIERVSTKILLTSLLIKNNKLICTQFLQSGLSFSTRDVKNISFNEYSVNNKMFTKDVLDLIEEKGGLDNFLSEYSHIQSDKIINLFAHYYINDESITSEQKNKLTVLLFNNLNKASQTDRKIIVEKIIKYCIEYGQHEFIKYLADGFINELDKYNTNVPDNRRFNCEPIKDVLNQSIEGMKKQEGSTEIIKKQKVPKLVILALVKILWDHSSDKRANTADVNSTLDNPDVASASCEKSNTL